MRTPSLKFYLKPIVHNRYSHTVNLRIVYDRKKAELSTKMRCKSKDWDKHRERFRNNIIFNQRLADLETRVYKAHHDLEALGRGFGPKDILALMGEGRRPKTKLSEFYTSYLEGQEEKGLVGESTKAKYRQTNVYLKKYMEERDMDHLVRQIDFHYITKWDDWLKVTPYNEEGARLKLNTVNKHHSRLKAVLNEAVKRGQLDINPYDHFRLKFPQTNREYLTQEELEMLKDVDLSDSDSSDLVRDVFLFSCYTGLRFGDAMALTMDKIVKIGSDVYLRIDQIKTGERREIPLLGAALEIIEKHSWCHERMHEQKVLPTFSNQKVNMYLKFIADKAGIRKHLTHHVARHTCATTVLLDNGVPLETVSHWLGHNSVRTTQIYAKISHNNLSRELNRLNSIL